MREFSFLQNVTTDTGAHSAICLIGSGILFWWHSCRPECDIVHSQLPNTEVKNGWSYTGVLISP